MFNTIDEPGAATGERRGSWRDVLPIHPAAEMFPRMSEAELAALAEDIKAHGIRNPIVLWVPGSPDDEPEPPPLVLDGINRLDALELAGRVLVEGDDPTDPFTSFFFGCVRHKYASECDPYAYVLSANLLRRHLTGEQKRDIIAKVLKAQPSKSNRTIAKQTKVDDKTVGSVRRELEGRAEIPHVKTVEDTKGRKQPSKKKRRDIDDFLADKRAREAATQPAPTVTMPTSDAIGPDSRGEVERLQARIEELHQQLVLKDLRIAALEYELAELTRIPEFLRRAP